MNLQLSDLTREMLLDGEFLLFESYLVTMESFLEALAREAQNEETYLDDEVSGLEDGSEESEFIGFRSLMVQEFNSVLRGSFFVSLYSFFETMLEKECRSRTSRIAGACFSGIQGQSGFFLEKVEAYLTTLGVVFPSKTVEWQEIKNYRRLRNCIVHNRARISENGDSRLRKYVLGKKSLRCVDDEILLEKEFCTDACETIKTFLRQLSFGKR
jgi:hypothetical protein